MTLTIESPQVYTARGVAISVTGIAQVTYSYATHPGHLGVTLVQ